MHADEKHSPGFTASEPAGGAGNVQDMPVCEQTLALLERLREPAERLARVIHDREQAFLDLGARVQEAAGKVTDLRQLATTIAESASGHEMQEVIAELSHELEKLDDVCSPEDTEKSLCELETIFASLSDVFHSSEEFSRIVRSLQMLGISTRIESARLGQAGRSFATLADDVEKLAVTIVASSKEIHSKGTFLSSLVTDAHARTTEITESQQGCTMDILSSISGNMDRLSEMAEGAERGAAELPEQAKKINRATGEVVASLQFHDIVRQQVEHVSHALDDVLQLALDVDEAATPEELECSEGLTGFAADVLKLQSSQLSHSSHEFTQAVESLRAHLSDIAVEVRAIGERTGRLLGGEDSDDAPKKGGGSALERIEATVEETVSTMRTFAEQGEGIATIMNNVASTVAEMGGFVEDIEEVESEIELIAINASIKAAHTGEEGAALGVLAESIQSLSVKARTETETASTVLGRIAKSSETLQQSSADSLDHTELDGLMDGMHGLTDRLRTMQGRIGSLFASLQTDSAELAEMLDSVGQAVDFHHDVAAELEGVRVELAAISEGLHAIAPPHEEEHRSARLNEMLSRYTMEAERSIHHETFGQEYDAATDDVELFGDDDGVELFGDDEAPEGGDVEDDDNVELF